jgi:hypothetical protein
MQTEAKDHQTKAQAEIKLLREQLETARVGPAIFNIGIF